LIKKNINLNLLNLKTAELKVKRMNNTIQLSPKDMINAYLLFFVVHSAQIGVGVHGFQRIVYQDAKHDAWISVLLAGLATHIVAFCMIKTLEVYGSN
jgi:hypothetical protein